MRFFTIRFSSPQTFRSTPHLKFSGVFHISHLLKKCLLYITLIAKDFFYHSFLSPMMKIPFVYHTCYILFDWQGAAIGLAVFARPPLLVFAEGGVAVFFPEMGEAGGVANFDFFHPVADFPGTLPQRWCLGGTCSGGAFLSFGIIMWDGVVRFDQGRWWNGVVCGTFSRFMEGVIYDLPIILWPQRGGHHWKSISHA